MHRPPELAYKYDNLSEGECKPGYAAAKMTNIYPKWEALLFHSFTHHFAIRSFTNESLKLNISRRKAKTATGTYRDAWCHSSSQLGLKGFESETEKPPHSYPIFPSFNHVSIIFSPTTKPRLCPCDPPVTQKNLCHPSTRSPIFLLSYPRALEAFSMNDTNWLPVLTHHASWYPAHTVLHGPLWCHWLFWFFSLPPFAAHLSSIYRALSYQHSWS